MKPKAKSPLLQIFNNILTHNPKSDMAMYIRVKRDKLTYFIQCDPTETTLDIKEKLYVLTDQPVNDQRLILLDTNDVLEDTKTLADQKVENDAVVALTLRRGCVPHPNDHHDNGFEAINIARPDFLPNP